MYKVHGYVDGVKKFDRLMSHLPRLSDTIRFTGDCPKNDTYGTVTEVIWCMDEPNCPKEWQRINLRIEMEKNEKQGATPTG